MRRTAAILVALAVTFSMVGCGNKASEPDTTPATTEETGGEEAEEASGQEADNSTGDKTFKVGFAQKNLANEFQNALAAGIEDAGKARGWDVTVLSAEDDIEKELANVETFIANECDLIFMNVVDNEAGVAAANTAMEAGIPVIEIDSIVTDPSAVITIVYSPNYGNGRVTGLYMASDFAEDEEIICAVMCGNKGNRGGQDRSEGQITGLLEGRLGCSEEEAHELAIALYDEMNSKGSARNEEAKVTLAAQGWGNWTDGEGLAAMEDILSAHSDINAVIGENDSMLIGALQAIQDAGLEDQISIYAAADAMKEALELIKEGGCYKCTGLNSPAGVAEKAAQIADEILLNGADWESFDDFTETDPVCVDASNVDEYYDPAALF